MSMHKLEFVRLLCQKVMEASILLLSIGLEIIGECAQAHLLKIKRDGVKMLREVLESLGIVERCN